MGILHGNHMMLYKVVLTFESRVEEILNCALHVVLFTKLYKVILIFESVVKVLPFK